MILKKMFKRPDLRNENPWVVVDSKTYEIIREGSFSDLLKLRSGHLMTKSVYNQIMEERTRNV